MRFSIITPTYRNSKQLQRAVASLQAQTYRDWEMIIVNDSPYDTTYTHFAASINNPRIYYHRNAITQGSNASKNIALEKISADSRWIIFLDDDEYLSPDTLKNFSNLILLYPNQKWFMTNKALPNGISITHVPQTEATYLYDWNFLVLRRLRGKATHCIETKLITQTNSRFSRYVKHNEEWFFFYQVGLHSKLLYSDHNSTICNKSTFMHNQNYHKRKAREKYESLTQLAYEATTRKILHGPFIIYIFLRYILILFKK